MVPVTTADREMSAGLATGASSQSQVLRGIGAKQNLKWK